VIRIFQINLDDPGNVVGKCAKFPFFFSQLFVKVTFYQGIKISQYYHALRIYFIHPAFATLPENTLLHIYTFLTFIKLCMGVLALAFLYSRAMYIQRFPTFRKLKTRENAIVECLDYQIPITQ